MKKSIISVAQQFSRFPAGRVRTDGDFSGERFREEFIVPALVDQGRVSIELDGAAGYGSSFLEEAFGGLVRHNKFTEHELRERLTLVSKDQTLEHEIWSYIHDESERLGRK
jgi:predicted oxidoreductase